MMPQSSECTKSPAIPSKARLTGQSVIAVSGLASHALGSFKAPNKSEVWLRDFLPRDVPSIRVLIYGYDTRQKARQRIPLLIWRNRCWDPSKSFEIALMYSLFPRHQWEPSNTG